MSSPILDVLIIGAGAAGIATAKHLLASNPSLHVTLVEARNRVGGRLHTLHLPSMSDIPLDAGGAWIHGASDANPALAWFNELQHTHQSQHAQAQAAACALARGHNSPAKTAEAAPGVPRRRTVLVDAEVGWVPDDVRSHAYTNARRLRQAEHVARRLFLQRGLDDVSVAQALAAQVATLPGEGVLARSTDFFRARVEQYEAMQVDDLSLLNYETGELLPGGDFLVPGGYGALVTRVAEGLDVRLEHVVRCVVLDSEREVVRVECDGGQVLEARYVVSTLPLGVMQAGSVKFEPALPEEKVASIARLGVAVMNKVFLRFERRFWEEHARATVIGVTPASADERHVNSWFLNLSGAQDDEAILACFQTCRRAKKMEEEMSDKEIVAACVASLRDGFAAAGVEVPDPLASHVTRWATDPYALCSYTGFQVGSSGADIERWAEPCWGGRLGFAGEGTTVDELGCAHGAVLTGYREADRIRVLVGQEGGGS